MLVVTSHNNADFDALASLIAASFLYPEAVRVMPSQVQPAVRDFLAIHWDILRLRPRRGLDLAAISRLVVTDTGSWERLDGMAELALVAGLPVVVWDHHMEFGEFGEAGKIGDIGEAGRQGKIIAEETHREEVGATVTLLLEELERRDTPFSPIHATLFLLGIYDDTGSLSFPNTTARDARMAAFLLANGADLNVVSAYQSEALDSRHLDLFSRMLAEAEQFSLGGRQFGVCVQETDKGLNMLPTVVSKFKEIQGLDAAFGVFPMGPEKTVVIARGNPRRCDVGAVVRRLGGGGHPGAGSAMLRVPLVEARQRLITLLHDQPAVAVTVAALMSPVGMRLSPATRVDEAVQALRASGRQALLVVDDDGRLLGAFGEEQVLKIRQERQRQQPVTAMMRRQVPSVPPQLSLREALAQMSGLELGFLPVVEQERLLGEITRAAIILNLYDF